MNTYALRGRLTRALNDSRCVYKVCNFVHEGRRGTFDVGFFTRICRCLYTRGVVFGHFGAIIFRGKCVLVYHDISCCLQVVYLRCPDRSAPVICQGCFSLGIRLVAVDGFRFLLGVMYSIFVSIWGGSLFQLRLHGLSTGFQASEAAATHCRCGLVIVVDINLFVIRGCQFSGRRFLGVGLSRITFTTYSLRRQVIVGFCLVTYLWMPFVRFFLVLFIGVKGYGGGFLGFHVFRSVGGVFTLWGGKGAIGISIRFICIRVGGTS